MKDADFALGLYYDGIVDESYKHPMFLSRQFNFGIQRWLVEKGFIQDKLIDLANWWARGQRNRLYQKLSKRFPNRIKVVSRWFLVSASSVLDIIDHLSRTYAVYCVAAAGDTLRNYFSKEKNNGEYY
jgi:hypothetical protein